MPYSAINPPPSSHGVQTHYEHAEEDDRISNVFIAPQNSSGSRVSFPLPKHRASTTDRDGALSIALKVLYLCLSEADRQNRFAPH